LTNGTGASPAVRL
jgi:hypothetical protein